MPVSSPRLHAALKSETYNLENHSALEEHSSTMVEENFVKGNRYILVSARSLDGIARHYALYKNRTTKLVYETETTTKLTPNIFFFAKKKVSFVLFSKVLKKIF